MKQSFRFTFFLNKHHVLQLNAYYFYFLVRYVVLILCLKFWSETKFVHVENVELSVIIVKTLIPLWLLDSKLTLVEFKVKGLHVKNGKEIVNSRPRLVFATFNPLLSLICYGFVLDFR